MPEENIITPDASVAGPAIEALRFSAHHEEIREMFSSLLATAMNSEEAEKAHPSFVEIIKQLSPDEAIIMSAMRTSGYHALLSVKSVDLEKGESFIELKRNFSNIPYLLGCKHPEMSSSYIENLSRLGLIEINNQTEVVDDYRYENLIYSPTIQQVVSGIDLSERKVEYSKYVSSRTEFGQKFVSACTTS
ncbi:DUF4393 domain-containing protein [Planococcus shenhongbingii]|uniref:DUF4393 domain-containing protein n=1 Tax=Planococcus shenhongbingii TaxID=3058398 RepID=UPI0026160F87|nr:DUF4393 domain-containing protein [Planococcus sp. N016]WKA57150.1 DUF4393 domain-containing protein [Planococcus sp. N016]